MLCDTVINKPSGLYARRHREERSARTLVPLTGGNPELHQYATVSYGFYNRKRELLFCAVHPWICPSCQTGGTNVVHNSCFM